MEPNYSKIDKTLSITQANVLGTMLIIPILALYAIPYSLIWGLENLMGGLLAYFNNIFLMALIFILGILFHEGLHGITWMVVGHLPKASIEYGIKWQYLTPYAHLKVPVRKNLYQIGGMMPGVILGILPGIFGLVSGNGKLLWFGLFFYNGGGRRFHHDLDFKRHSKKQPCSRPPRKSGLHDIDPGK